MKKLIISLILAAGAVCAQPYKDIYLDIQEMDRPFSVESAQGTTPNVRGIILDNGAAYTNLAGYTGQFNYFPSWDSTQIVQVTTTEVSSNAIIWRFAASDTNTNGTNFAQVVLISPTTNTLEWGRGTMILRKSPGTSGAGAVDWATPFNWGLYTFTGTGPWYADVMDDRYLAATATFSDVETDPVWTTQRVDYATTAALAAKVSTTGDVVTGNFDIAIPYYLTNNVVSNFGFSSSTSWQVTTNITVTNWVVTWESDNEDYLKIYKEVNAGATPVFTLKNTTEIPPGYYKCTLTTLPGVEELGEHYEIYAYCDDQDDTLIGAIASGESELAYTNVFYTAFPIGNGGHIYFKIYPNNPRIDLRVNSFTMQPLTTQTQFSVGTYHGDISGGALMGAWTLNGTNLNALAAENDPVWTAASGSYLRVTNSAIGFEMRGRDGDDYDTLLIGNDTEDGLEGRVGLWSDSAWWYIESDAGTLTWDGEKVLTVETDPVWVAASSNYLTKSGASAYYTIASYQQSATNGLKMSLVSVPASNTAAGAKGQVAIDHTNLYIYNSTSNKWLLITGGTLEW